MNEIDLAGLPTTFAIIGFVFLVAIALRYVNKTYPQIGARIKNKTPWMGWCEETDASDLRRRTTRNTW